MVQSGPILSRVVRVVFRKGVEEKPCLEWSEGSLDVFAEGKHSLRSVMFIPFHDVRCLQKSDRFICQPVRKNVSFSLDKSLT